MKRPSMIVIEDEPDILELLEYNLTRDGYRVRSTKDGEEGLRMIRQEPPDLVLLDLMLPGLDGLDVCRKLKEDPVTRPIPLIMVTARGEETDVVLGLGLGADDYITKPFSPKELLARVKAVLRRGSLREDGDEQETIVRGELRIDPSRHEVCVGGSPVIFTATEFRLLHYLAAHPGRVFAREHLLSRVHGDGGYIGDRNVDVHVRALRQKLGNHRELIETIRGVGYRFQDIRE